MMMPTVRSTSTLSFDTAPVSSVDWAIISKIVLCHEVTFWLMSRTKRTQRVRRLTSPSTVSISLR
jgi:hypothetical protein